MEPGSPASMLRATGLTFRYPGGTTALDGLDVDVPPGATGLVGANGAGKTTLFRLMLGLLPPTAGSIDVVGRPVVDDPVAVRSRVGYMPEHDCLPGDQPAADLVATIGEIAGLPPRAARQRASDVLDLVGLDEARFRPTGGFSTGMRQRTKLAQALVAGPELVLLDEPTAGLDPVGRETMLDLVGRLSEFGISVLFATHLLDDVQQVCDHVIMVDGGRLVVAGPVDDLVERSGVIRVQVGGGETGDPTGTLAGALAGHGLATAAVDPGTLDIEIADRGDQVFDTVRDEVAGLGLRLYSLSTRHRSLDALFMEDQQ